MKQLSIMIFSLSLIMQSCSNLEDIEQQLYPTRAVRPKDVSEFPNSPSGGNFVNQSGGLSAIDAGCRDPSDSRNFKAMVVDGVNRIASVGGNTGDGQKDWPLYPETAYRAEWGNNTIAFLTDKNGLVDLQNSNSIPNTTVHPNEPNFYIWTGLNADFTTSSDCSDWSVNGAQNGAYGNMLQKDVKLFSAGTTTCNGTGLATLPKILCVEY